MTTIAELKIAIRKEMNEAHSRMSDAEDRNDDAAVKVNRAYARKCQIALEIIADIESDS